MSLLIYILLVIITCSIASIPSNSNNMDSISGNSGIYTKKYVLNHRLRGLSILLISILLSIYSMNMEFFGVLIDRVNYTFSFLYRYPNYYKSLEDLFSAKIEPGIVLFSMIISSATKDSRWLFFCITLISTLINLYVISKVNKYYVSCIALFMLSLFFFQGTFLLKQAMAVAFANLAILNLTNNKPTKYFLYSLVACIFHSTSVILFPIYFLFVFTKSKRMYVIIFFVFSVLFVYLSPMLNAVISSVTYVEQYLATEEINYSFGGGSTTSVVKGIPFYLISILALANREELKKLLKNADIYILASVVYSISWLLTFHMYWFFRIGWYFMLPTLLLIPPLFQCLKEKKAHLFLGCIAIIFMILITFRQIIITLN